MIEITIKDGDSIKTISAEKITFISDVMQNSRIVVFCEGAYHSGGTVNNNTVIKIGKVEQFLEKA